MTAVQAVQKDLDDANQKIASLETEISRLRKLLPAEARHTRHGTKEFWNECAKRLGLSDIEYFKDLIENGKISMFATNGSGQTLLLLAAKRGSYEVAQLCLNLGADIYHKQDGGKDAVDLARDGAWYHIEQLLLFARMEGNLGDVVTETADVILKQHGFIENVMAALKVHKDKKLIMDSFVDIMIGILKRKQCFSEDMLHLCWEFCASNENNPLQSKLWAALIDTCSEVINSENKLWWSWMKKFIMPSMIWFEDTAKWEAPVVEKEPEVGNCPEKCGLVKFQTPRANFGCDVCSKRFPAKTTLYGCRTCNYDMCGSCYFGAGAKSDSNTNNDDEKDESKADESESKKKERHTYLYYKLLDLVEEKAKKQMEELEIPMNALKEQHPEAWQELITWDVVSTFENSKCRQDRVPHGLKAEYDPLELAQATTSSTQFNSAQHYDYNEYLSAMVLTAYMVDDEFQESVQSIFGIDSRSNSAIDANGDAIRYERGPVKLMARCRAKAENDYANEEFPTSACVLDLNRCSLVFTTFESLLLALKTFIDKVRHYEGHAIIDVVRDKNGFVEYVQETCYADIKLNVLVRGDHNNIIGEVQFLLQTMKDFKAKAHNLYNITRKEEFISHTSKILPMLLDHEKALFVHGNNGESKGLGDLMLVSNKPAKFIMKIDEESKESILLNMASLGKSKALRFLQTIIPSDLFVDRMFFPNRYNSIALEPAVSNKHLMTVKVLLSSPEIQTRYQQNKDYLWRIVYKAISSYDSKMWEFVTSALNITDEKLLELVEHTVPKCGEDEFAKGHYEFFSKTLVGGSCLGEDPGGAQVLIALLGEDKFAELAFEVDVYDVNHVERCIQNMNFKKSKFLLGIGAIAQALKEANTFFRYMCWVMRSSSDEFFDWFIFKYSLDEQTFQKYLMYDQFPEPDDEKAKKLDKNAWSYHDKSIMHWSMWSANMTRFKFILGLIDKADWYGQLTKADKNGWKPFAILIYNKQFECCEYILDNISPGHRQTLINLGLWMKKDEKIVNQLKEWKVKYS